MKLNEIRPAEGEIKNRKRRGRGNASGLGGESGRGHKGQKSRSGYSQKFGFEGGQTPLFRRLPKKRGFNRHYKVSFLPINLDRLNVYPEGTIVDPARLALDGIIKSEKDLVKILGQGVLEKKLTIKAHAVSKTALAALEKVGASFEQLS